MATERPPVESIGSYFESLPAPRHTQNRKHLFLDITVCELGGPTAIRRWATKLAPRTRAAALNLTGALDLEMSSGCRSPR